MISRPNRLVLVVDDYEPLRFLKTYYFRGAGFQVTQAGTGMEALQTMEAQPPHLVMLDVNLPDMHGLEVCQEIKARWTIPVIYTSSVDIPQELDGTADGGVVGVEEQDLLDAARHALDTTEELTPPDQQKAISGRTQFASARRSPPQELEAQARLFDSGLLRAVLDASTIFVLVVNQNRQIVYCNRAALHLIGAPDQSAVVGLRPGEALQCVNASRSPSGCGTTESCQTCGAVRSILEGLRGVTSSRECRITRVRRSTEDASDLLITCLPIPGTQGLVTCTVADISHEKRRRALERIFFHDILNIASGVKGLAAQLGDGGGSGNTADFAALIEQSASELVAEIQSQQQLFQAEANQLAITPARVASLKLVQAVAAHYRSHAVCRQRTVLIDPSSNDVEILTEPSLLTRVLGNMLKNALEATQPGETVTIGCQAADGIEFWVHNAGVIPRDAQLQIFQRSFTSKGEGRGLGTYSMKLLTEQYLGGTVSFESSPLNGTRFVARCPLTLPARNGGRIGQANYFRASAETPD